MDQPILALVALVVGVILVVVLGAVLHGTGSTCLGQ